mmetsp:Transcript_7107/g.15608  ORF Transcript_7107/g.15608 Transcript_7107/m.15608 type:complete len:87 (+) Transcript_7107:324-584(+)
MGKYSQGHRETREGNSEALAIDRETQRTLRKMYSDDIAIVDAGPIVCANIRTSATAISAQGPGRPSFEVGLLAGHIQIMPHHTQHT